MTESSNLPDRSNEVAKASEPVHFEADARLLSILGEQLIGSEKVGVLELIKNAYDAGASLCSVVIDAVANLGPERLLSEFDHLPGPVIVVRDDGSGMTRNELIGGWLRPATASRGAFKERLRKEKLSAQERGTPDTFEALVEQLKAERNGRLPLGEKGVGRLATHRLGEHLWLRTKTEDDQLEWELRVDWSKFESVSGAPIDLRDVTLELVHQPVSTDYGPKNRGTVIVCYGGRSGYVWKKEALHDLNRAIASLQSPRAHAGFKATFETPHLSAEELETSSHLVAPFELVAVVDENGVADIDLQYSPPDHLEHAPKEFRRLDHIDLKTKDLEAWTVNGVRQMPVCGPFLVHAHCWLRLPKWLGPDYRAITDYLDRFGGLAIYRDGILAQPAQQSARSDWLGLATQQIKKASRLSYYQLIGEIEIQQEYTLSLRDRSSREGMIETQAYRDLGELTKAILSHLETHTRLVRQEWTFKSRSRRVSSPTAIAASRASARLFTTLASDYDFKKDPWKLRSIDPALRSPARAEAIAETLRGLPDFIATREEERNGLLEAAGYGLAVAVAVHEIARVASGIASDSRALARLQDLSDQSDRLRRLGTRADGLLTEVRRLAPLRTARTEALQPVSIRRAADAARSALGSAMDAVNAGMRIEGEDFSIDARFGAMSQVFANLLDNAVYWLGSVEEPRQIRLVLSAKDRTALFADSGPGISDRILPVLFQPFFSEKANPSGLGLYICRYYLSQFGASIRLAKASERLDMRGAQFLLDFRRSKSTVS